MFGFAFGALIVFLQLMLASNALGAVERPTYDGGEQTVASDHIVVHYGSWVSSDTAHSALTEADKAWGLFQSQLGFAPPLSDAAEDPVGDGRADFYLMPIEAIGANRGGYAYPLFREGSETAPGFVVLEESAAAGGAAHEMFHLFQFAVDARELDAPNAWWTEMTANWAADLVAPGSRVARSTYEGSPFCADGPEKYGQIGSCHGAAYAWWPFVTFLERKLGSGFVRKVWARQAELGRGNNTSHAREAIEQLLGERKTSLDTELRLFIDEQSLIAAKANKAQTLGVISSIYLRRGTYRRVDRAPTVIPAGSAYSNDFRLKRGSKSLELEILGGNLTYDKIYAGKKGDPKSIKLWKATRIKGGLRVRLSSRSLDFIRLVAQAPASASRKVQIGKAVVK